MRRLLRSSKKRTENRGQESPFGDERPGNVVEPDEEVSPSEHGHRPLVEAGSSAIADPTEWANEKRRSLGRRSQHSSHSGVSPDRRTGTSRASRASFDDIYSDDVPVDSILNPDVEAQIDADSDEYDAFDIPKPGTTEKMPRGKPKSKTDKPKQRVSTRLSMRLSKLVSGSSSKAAAREAAAPAAESAKPKSSEKGASKGSVKGAVLRTSKRLSMRKPVSAEKQAAKAAKIRAKQEKKDEERRLKEIRSNPWYPAGVDFKFLSPKPVWIPFLGRRASAAELDFGNEARLVGASA